MEMKPYKIKCEILITPSKDGKSVGLEQLFVCDKTKCPKTICEKSDCFQTADINYAKRFDIR